MIIQNNSQMSPVQQPDIRVSDNPPKAVAGISLHSAQDAPQQTSSLQLKAAVESINQVMRQSNKNLEFSFDSDTNRVIVKMVDTESGELIRQIPSESALAIARAIDQFQQLQHGLLLDQKA